MRISNFVIEYLGENERFVKPLSLFIRSKMSKKNTGRKPLDTVPLNFLDIQSHMASNLHYFR